jgi:hypothetical protein
VEWLDHGFLVRCGLDDPILGMVDFAVNIVSFGLLTEQL